MDGTTPEEYLGFQKMSPRPKSRWRQPTVLSLLVPFQLFLTRFVGCRRGLNPAPASSLFCEDSWNGTRRTKRFPTSRLGEEFP